MYKAHKLRQNPIKDAYHKRRILKIRIDSVRQMRSIPLVPNVIHNAQRTWNVQSNSVRVRSTAQIGQSANQFVGV